MPTKGRAWAQSSVPETNKRNTLEQIKWDVCTGSHNGSHQHWKPTECKVHHCYVQGGVLEEITTVHELRHNAWGCSMGSWNKKSCRTQLFHHSPSSRHPISRELILFPFCTFFVSMPRGEVLSYEHFTCNDQGRPSEQLGSHWWSECKGTLCLRTDWERKGSLWGRQSHSWWRSAASDGSGEDLVKVLSCKNNLVSLYLRGATKT